MPFFTEMTATTFWIIAMVVFLIIEAATVGIASIWFAIGAFISRIIYRTFLWKYRRFFGIFQQVNQVLRI